MDEKKVNDDEKQANGNEKQPEEEKPRRKLKRSVPIQPATRGEVKPKSVKPKSSSSKSSKPKKGKYKCIRCGKIYDVMEGNFRIMRSEDYANNEHRLPICNTCLEEIFNEYLAIFDDDIRRTIKFLCQRYDIYYDQNVVERLINRGDDSQTIMVQYLKTLNFAQYKSKTYLDNVKKEIMMGIEDVELEEEEQTKTRRSEEDEILKASRKIFGNVSSKQDAIKLKELYDDWKAKTGATSIVEETAIKNICWNILDIDKARKLGNPTDKLEKTLNDNIVFGGWKPDKRDEKLSEDTLGVLIRKAEMNFPIEEWEDKSEIDKIVRVAYLGHAAASYGMKNIYSQEYEDFMKEYEVRKSTDSIDNDENLDTIIFGDDE